MIETWKLILDAIKFTKESLSGEKKLSSEKKALILREFIEPAYHDLEQVYKDYQFAFEELEENISQKKNPEETIRLFRKRSYMNRDTRMKLKELNTQLMELKLLRHLNDENLKSVCRFALATDAFFDATGKHQNISWFEGFVEELEFNLKKGVNPFEVFSFKTISGGQNCWPTVRDSLRYAKNEAMPKAWLEVLNSYSALKGALLD